MAVLVGYTFLLKCVILHPKVERTAYSVIAVHPVSPYPSFSLPAVQDAVLGGGLHLDIAHRAVEYT